MAAGGIRQRLSMISTVTHQGRANRTIIIGALYHERLIAYLQPLLREGRRQRKKVYLILGSLGAHLNGPVNAWLAKHRKKTAHGDRVGNDLQDPIVMSTA
jgi:hypothetical protein